MAIPPSRTDHAHPVAGGWSGIVWGILSVGFVAAVVLIWWRNHDILRDLFDHATMIGAAGKIEHGFKPYVDVRSPMQTSVYYFNWAAEKVFGHSYLGLSRGGLVQALGGALLMFGLIWRQWNRWAALALTAAVTFGGLSQHSEFFYNPIGICCLTLVAVGLARDPNLDDLRSGRAWLVLLALAISGTNKLNFHGLMLAIAGVLLLQAWSIRELTGARLGRQLALLFLAGIVVPLAFELGWTGASPALWVANVVTGPSARYIAATHWLDPRNFIRPAANFHHHLLLPCLGGIGLLVVLGIGSASVWCTRRRETAFTQFWRLALLGGGSVGAALLMVTNYETVSLTSLAFLLVAVVTVQRLPDDIRAVRWLRGAALWACLPWIVNGAYSAWYGSRILYGITPPDRADYVRLVDAPKALSYFEGVRFEQAQLASLRELASALAAMEDTQGKLRGVVFGPALEWLERVYPEGMVRGMPIWYHNGTSLAYGDQPWFAANMAAAGAIRVVVHREWQAWPVDIDDWLHTAFCVAPISDRYLMYHPIAPIPPADVQAPDQLPEPRAFLDQTGSNISIRATRAGAGFALRDSVRGPIWASTHTDRWDWPMRPHHLTVELVAQADEPVTTAGKVTFRVVAIAEDGSEQLLHEIDLPVSPAEPVQFRTVTLQPYGRRLRWEVQPSPGAPPLRAGWREIHVLHSDLNRDEKPVPLLPWLQPIAVRAEAAARAASPLPFIWFAAAGSIPASPSLAVAAGSLQAPFEQWHRQPSGSTHCRARLRFAPAAGTGPATAPIIVALCAYRDGRYDIAREVQVAPGQTEPLEIEGWMPESEAWVVLQVRPAGSGGKLVAVQGIDWLEP